MIISIHSALNEPQEAPASTLDLGSCRQGSLLWSYSHQQSCAQGRHLSCLGDPFGRQKQVLHAPSALVKGAGDRSNLPTLQQPQECKVVAAARTSANSHRSKTSLLTEGTCMSNQGWRGRSWEGEPFMTVWQLQREEKGE